jgi:peptidoglycan/LPS O-acetylase OafA/YrhL
MHTLSSRRILALDGLRGIAILAVLVHHQLTPLLWRGGFLGVDLFFVLSGFLITSLLLVEFEQAHSISLRKFYMRRILRLGPALFLYLLGSLLVTWHTQFIEVIRELKLIGMAMVYVTNWRMALGWDNALDPTAIIWSLSIEEQFYLLWPLLLFACLALKLKGRLIVGGLVLAIAAIAVHRYSLLGSGVDLTRLYYGTDTRADALLVGCVIAFVPVIPLRAEWFSRFGLLAAAALVYLIARANFSDLFLYRGGFTMLALLVGIIILAVANAPRSPLALVLGWWPLRWFGKISYGLYLWHWLVIRNVSFYFLGRWNSGAKLALALTIASASFYLVEQPFNRMKRRYEVTPDHSAPGVDPDPALSLVSDLHVEPPSSAEAQPPAVVPSPA